MLFQNSSQPFCYAKCFFPYFIPFSQHCPWVKMHEFVSACLALINLLTKRIIPVAFCAVIPECLFFLLFGELFYFIAAELAVFFIVFRFKIPYAAFAEIQIFVFFCPELMIFAQTTWRKVERQIITQEYSRSLRRRLPPAL